LPRQLTGANISMRQVFEADKKMRAVSLLTFSQFIVEGIDSAIQSEDITREGKIADSITEGLHYDITPSQNDLSNIYYVNGFVARSAVSTMKCDHCKEKLLCSIPEIVSCNCRNIRRSCNIFRQHQSWIVKTVRLYIHVGCSLLENFRRNQNVRYTQTSIQFSITTFVVPESNNSCIGQWKF
jgi:hypothetical protein